VGSIHSRSHFHKDLLYDRLTAATLPGILGNRMAMELVREEIGNNIGKEAYSNPMKGLRVSLPTSFELDLLGSLTRAQL
jgi:hypothetical protein